MSGKMLIVVDPQVDFITGSLAVVGAEAAIDRLAEYVAEHGSDYSSIAITLDHHPFDHISFVQNGGRWPEHCVAFSRGSAVIPRLMESLRPFADRIMFLTKGDTADREEYSIFRNHISTERIVRTVDRLNITDIDLCGIAGDVCVADTLTDGVNLMPDLHWQVLIPFTASIDGGKHLQELSEKLNIKLCDA